jgi:hypothetical protein
MVYRIEHGQTELWLVGYIDYRDRFGGEHRNEYGRHYLPSPHVTEGDLRFDVTIAALNTDRPLTEVDSQERERHRAAVIVEPF